jgi:osmotically-inducible protein OsmY
MLHGNKECPMRNPKAVASDLDLRDLVEEELSWDPRVDATRIHVAANDGAIVLGGSVDSFPQKQAAVRAAERIHGVLAVADEVDVVLPDAVTRADAEIAAEIARRRMGVFPDSVVVEVSRANVTLRGDVASADERAAAVGAVARIEGVLSIVNDIEISSVRRPTEDEVRQRIERALVRQADLDARSIHVTTDDDGVVRLQGAVTSLADRRLAEAAAESAPGVAKVVNEVDVMIAHEDA